MKVFRLTNDYKYNCSESCKHRWHCAEESNEEVGKSLTERTYRFLNALATLKTRRDDARMH